VLAPRLSYFLFPRGFPVTLLYEFLDLSNLAVITAFSNPTHFYVLKIIYESPL
jgi:hypothetical protein